MSINKVSPKIKKLNEVIAALEQNTPEGRVQAQKLLTDFYDQHKKQMMKRKTAKMRGKKRWYKRKGGNAQMRRQKSDAGTTEAMQATQAEEIMRKWERGTEPTAPQALPLVQQPNEWLETAKSE